MNAEKSHATLMPHLAIDHDRALELALETGFCKRIRKIEPVMFWETFCIEAVQGTLSYNDLAARLEALGAPSVSRQAIGKKITPECQLFFERMLDMAMADQFEGPEIERLHDSCCFKRIIVQDSTVLRLPRKLYEVFSGVKNGHSTVCNARVQGVYDILSAGFIQYSIDPYSRNDLVAALDFLPQPGDLVLKDRGYYKPEAIRSCIEQKADCIFRYKHPTIFHCAKTGKKLGLAGLLNEHGSIDRRVIMSSEKLNEVTVRLVAFPVPEEVANLRRMKAKKEQKGRAPSKDVLYLMGWSIFITTLSKDHVSAKQLAELYGLRWRIENIFRTWKSNFCFDHIHNVSEVQLRMLLIARLTVIVILHHQIFIPVALALAKLKWKLSLMNFMRYAQRNLSHLLNAISVICGIEELIAPMIRYCTMSKRKRLSLDDRLTLVLSEIGPIPLS
jgi:hypothetical protein